MAAACESDDHAFTWAAVLRGGLPHVVGRSLDSPLPVLLTNAPSRINTCVWMLAAQS
jgi:hypothetical protein